MPVFVTCNYCGKEVSRCKSKVKNTNFCSHKCAGKYKRNKVEVTCHNCGSVYKIKPFHVKDRNFCNRQCFGEWQSNQTREVNKVECYCVCCGKIMERFPSQLRDNAFCSRECSGSYQSSKISGSNHWNWKGGITNRSTRDTGEWRIKVFERDNYTCQKCGQRGGELNAHHILGWARYESARFKLSNGITLCKNCHIDFHNTYTKFRFTEEDLEEFL